MSEPQAPTPHCDHFAKYGEGVEWPIEISLAHFDDCLAPEKRIQYWVHARDMANRALVCEMRDHSGAIESQRGYTLKLLTEVRALIDEGSRDGAHIRLRLQELIS
jgi:hypothetical protein